MTAVNDQITESDLELKQFECPQCDELFPSTNGLFSHMRTQHSNPTKCHLCNRDLKSLTNRLSHSYIHKQIKPYKCPNNNCSYECRTRFNLKVHLIRCAGIERFGYSKRNNKKLRVIARSEPKCNQSMPQVHHNTSNIMQEIGDSGSLSIPDVYTDSSHIISIHKDFVPSCETFDLFVHLSDRMFTLRVKASDTIQCVKQQIQTIEKIPVELQTLCLNDEQLESHKTMSHYNIWKRVHGRCTCRSISGETILKTNVSLSLLIYNSEVLLLVP
eukprot:1007006_1